MRLRFFFFHILILVALSCGATGQLCAGEITVEASLSHASFPVERAAQLTISVNGSTRAKSIRLPEIDNIRFHKRGQSVKTSNINGAVTMSISYNYLVQALQPGDYTLPPISVKAGGESLSTKPLHFVVTGAGPQGGATAVAPGQNNDEPVFLRTSETAEHFPGEIVPITIKAYFSQEYRAESISLPTLQGDGVVMAQLKDKPHQGQEQIDGKLYTVLTWDTSLSGIKLGKHPIRFALDATLLIPQTRRSRSSFGGGSIFGDSMFNDPFFDSFFGGYERKPISVASPQTVFTVLPLPDENRPENFTGAIGDFDLKVSVSPLSVEVGEPLALTMEISGTGNFDRVEAPVFHEDPNWKTYSPTSNYDGREEASGKKTFEQAVVSKNIDATVIPSLSFSYFDPNKKKYITRTSSPIQINLKQSSSRTLSKPVPQATRQQQQQKLEPQPEATNLLGLAPIHLQTGPFQAEIIPLFKKSWFILLSLASLLGLMALFASRMRALKYARHPEILKQRSRRQQLERNLQQVRQAKTMEGSAFLAHARTTIQNQLGAMWDTPATAISLADLQARLFPDSPLVAIFKAADDAAYSGAPLSKKEMEEYYMQMKVELEKLL